MIENEEAFIFQGNYIFSVVMTDLGENLDWLIGSIVTAIALAIGWFISSGVVTNLLFLLLGAGITYFVQRHTQKRAWKREYSVKIVETVYGALFGDLKRIIRVLEGGGYPELSFGEWKDFQNDHRYIMVDERFRKRLDNFAEKVEKYRFAVYNLKNKVLPKIVNEETKRVFNVESDRNTELRVKYVEGNDTSTTSLDIIECLLSKNQTPTQYFLRKKPKVLITEYFVRIQKIGKVVDFRDSQKINEFWKSCLDRMFRDNTHNFVILEQQTILSESRKIMEEIVNRIQEPWKI